MLKRLESIERTQPFTVEVDGVLVPAYSGETLATVLLVSKRNAIRRTFELQEPRSYYCGMGICNECLVEVAEEGEVRACQTFAKPFMKIRTIG